MCMNFRINWIVLAGIIQMADHRYFLDVQWILAYFYISRLLQISCIMFLSNICLTSLKSAPIITILDERVS